MTTFATFIIPVRYKEHKNFTSVLMTPWRPFAHRIIKLNVRRQLRIENTHTDYLIFRDSDFVTPRRLASETIAVGQSTLQMSLQKDDLLISVATRGRGDMLEGIAPPPIPMRDMMKFVKYGHGITLNDRFGQLTFQADKQETHEV